MTELYLVRHGETDWNAARRIQGRTDIPLNDTGRAQARDAETMLEQWNWDAIVSSPLVRARETARIVAEHLGLPLGPAYDELVERDYGPLEGTPALEGMQRWPDRRYPGAEPLDEVVARCLRGLARIDADYPGQNVVVVCHGTIMKYTLIRLTGREGDTPLFHESFYEYVHPRPWLEEALQRHAFRVLQIADGESFGPLREDSPRMVMVAQKT